MVVVKLTETYDLVTQVGKMGIIGIHTPTANLISKVWGALTLATKKIRLVGCDVGVACASALPADPLQIGTQPGQIAPSDMFNPILYTAVTNEGFDRIITKMYTAGNLQTDGSVAMETWDAATNEKVYYAMLSQERFKKAMPQAGFRITGLVPLVHEVVTTYGNGEAVDVTGDVGAGSDSMFLRTPASETGYNTGVAKLMRGRAHPMPAIPTVGAYASNSSAAMSNQIALSFPKTFVACILLPPMKQTNMYFRMRVTWYLEFSGVRSDLESATVATIANAGNLLYYKATTDANMSKSVEMADTVGTDLDTVMQSDR